VSVRAGQPPAPAATSPIAPARTPWPALAALVALAALLRFATLRTQSIWFDEASTWRLMRLPFGELLHHVARQESSPPLFYVLEWGWTHVFGTRAGGLRSLSALAGTLTVPVAYALGARLAGAPAAPADEPALGAPQRARFDAAGGRSSAVGSRPGALTTPQAAGLAAAALVAVNPLLVWFSQEARAYALVVLLSAAALLAFLRACDEPKRLRWLAWWAVLGALALATHYFAAFVLVPQAAWLALRHPHRRASLGAVGALAAAGAALLPLLIAQHGNPYDIAGESLALRIAQAPKQFLLGYRGPAPLAFGLAGAALTLAGAWLLARRVEPRARRRTLGLAAIGLIGIALPVAAAAAGADYLNARNALPALVPLAAALGVACGASRPGRLGLALLTALCALSLAIVVAVAADRDYQRADWAGLARALGRSAVPRALVISPANGEAPLRFYVPGLRTLPAAGAAVREVDVVTVAGSNRPGGGATLPAQVGSALGVAGFEAPQRVATGSYELLRFRAPRPVPVTPQPLAAVRFSPQLPSVDLLPPGR
jgi:mannosyltransferase